MENSARDQAYARTTDPGTSKSAAHRIDQHVTRLEQIVLEALRQRRHRGGTMRDVAADTGLDLVTVSPRFKPLREKKLIKITGRKDGRAQIFVAAEYADPQQVRLL